MIKTLVGLSLAAVVLLAACSGTGSAVATPTAVLAGPPDATATREPLPSDTPLPAPSATETLTPTPGLPVFDVAALGDNRELDSFILTREDTTTGGGEVIELRNTIGFIKDPLRAYHLVTSQYGHPPEQYLIDGVLFEKNYSQDYWAVSLEPDPGDVDYLLIGAADMREGYPKRFVLGAQFVDRVDFDGIPANHFTFDETNLSQQSDPSGTYKIDRAQGDIVLSQDGNYLLRFHIRLTGNVYSPGGSATYVSGVREVNEELSSINQLQEITLPADFLALQVDLDLGLPVPAGARLHAIFHANVGSDYDLYDYFVPDTVSQEEFLEFYRKLGPTNDWTVLQVGGENPYETCQDRECVIQGRGNARALLAVSDQCVSNIPPNFACFTALYYR